jgi:eukaryotic-like serine/threonine-protein kinase
VASPARPQSVFRFDSFELDTRNNEVRKVGIPLKLYSQPYRVLLMLVEHSGEVVTREQIRRALWGDNTFVDFERGINFSINQIRAALSDDATNPRYVETIPRRGYRFIASVTYPDTEKLPVPAAGAARHEDAATDVEFPSRHDIHVLPTPAAFRVAAPARWGYRALIVVLPILAILVAGAFFVLHRTPKLARKDTIVLVDFTNTTGDPVFDGTLRQGLAVQLEQSPYLNIISEEQIQQTLPLMGQPSDVRLTPQIALQLCRRTSSTALLQGSIASIGSQYVLGLQVLNCATGASIADEQETAQGKGQVLGALALVATRARTKLGESRDTLERFNAPIEQVTTPSLAALQAYSLGRDRIRNDDDLAAVPFLEHAIQLDPNFAMAYASLGLVYVGTGSENPGVEKLLKAYELRSRVSERERFYIESHYYDVVLNDLEKGRQTYELWEQIYPRDEVPHLNLGGSIYYWLGEYEKGLGELRVELKLNPTKKVAMIRTADEYLALNRFAEAQSTAQEALAKYPDYAPLRLTLYDLAFLQNDPKGMEQQVVWLTGKSRAEALMLNQEGNTAAYFGRLGQARELSRRAIASAERDGGKESAIDYESSQAFREVLLGNLSDSRRRATKNLELSSGRYVTLRNAMTLVRAGETAKALTVSDQLGKQFPNDTTVQFMWLPMIYAQAALNHNDSSKAIEILQVSTPFELGMSRPDAFVPSLCTAYLRGEAFLAAGRAREAAAEFQKILDHRGIVRNDLIGALAHLQLGRADAMQADTANAKAAYQDFLALWKDADPDIPILKEAKAEYAKLQ